MSEVFVSRALDYWRAIMGCVLVAGIFLICAARIEAQAIQQNSPVSNCINSLTAQATCTPTPTPPRCIVDPSGASICPPTPTPTPPPCIFDPSGASVCQPTPTPSPTPNHYIVSFLGANVATAAAQQRQAMVNSGVPQSQQEAAQAVRSSSLSQLGCSPESEYLPYLDMSICLAYQPPTLAMLEGSSLESTVAAVDKPVRMQISGVTSGEALSQGPKQVQAPLTMTTEQWGLNNSTAAYDGSAPVDIDAPEGWGILQDASSVAVGIYDTGIKEDHSDIYLNMWTNPGEVMTPNSNDDDHNGVVDDIYGIDLTSYRARQGAFGDPIGHGTHVAGIIAANGYVSGVVANTKLVSIKAANQWSGTGIAMDDDDTLRAANYILMLRSFGVNIRVVNMSVGGWGCEYYIMQMIHKLGDAGVLIAAAAGNDHAELFPFSESPAACDDEGDSSTMITVAAINRTGQLASFSNYGDSEVDIAAPGVGILSTMSFGSLLGGSNNYASWDGTSMATPFVTGIAALLFQQDPSRSPADVRRIIMQTSRRLTSLEGKTVVPGVANLYNALRYSLGGGINPPPAVHNAISGKVSDRGVPISNVRVELSLNTSVAVSQVAYTDSNGNYSFAHVAQGSWSVRPRKTGYKFFSGYVPVYGTDVVKNFSALHPTVSGWISSASGAMSGVPVNLRRDDGAYNSVIYTDSTGFYQFRDLDLGTYSIAPSLYPYNFSPSAINSFPIDLVEADLDRNFNFVGSLPSGNITGSVTIGTTPLSSVSLTLSKYNVSWQSWQDIQSMVTAADGNFSFTISGGGNYKISASKSGYTFGTNIVSVTDANPSFHGLHIDAYRSATIWGTVNGLAVRNGTNDQVMICSEVGCSTTSPMIFTQYAISNMPAPGTYTLTPSNMPNGRGAYCFTPAIGSITLGPDDTSKQFDFQARPLDAGNINDTCFTQPYYITGVLMGGSYSPEKYNGVRVEARDVNGNVVATALTETINGWPGSFKIGPISAGGAINVTLPGRTIYADYVPAIAFPAPGLTNANMYVFW